MSIRKEVIGLWHPLAIDIQGLSEVENNTRLEYLKDIYRQRNANYHKQLLVDFWRLMVGFDKQFMNLTPKATYPTNYKEILSDYTVDGIEFEDFLSYTDTEEKSKLDIGLSKTLKSPNRNSHLVNLMILLDKFYDPELKEFPENLMEYLNKESDFYFPRWLSQLDKQFDKIADAVLNKNT